MYVCVHELTIVVVGVGCYLNRNFPLKESGHISHIELQFLLHFFPLNSYKWSVFKINISAIKRCREKGTTGL